MTSFDQGKQSPGRDQFNAGRINVTNFGIPDYLLKLKERNRLSSKVIARYAKKHAHMDVGIGLAGFIPIPGAALAALVASLVAQIPYIYRPMIIKLAEIYSAPPAMLTSQIVTANVVIEAGLQFVNTEVTSEVLQEIIFEAVQNASLGAVASMIPLVGGIAAATLDAVIAATLTWRVGTMTVAYYLNNSAWLRGSREETYETAKELVGGLSAKTVDRVDLGEVIRLKEVREKAIQAIRNTIAALRHAMHSITNAQIREALLKMAVPADLIDDALAGT
jgi:hypothetical protein